MPFWKTDLTGRVLVGSGDTREAWDDQHAGSLVCALPFDDGVRDYRERVTSAPTGESAVTADPAPTVVTTNARFYGSCCSFEATTGVAIETDIAAGTDFTVEAWVRLGASGEGTLFSVGPVVVAIAGTTVPTISVNGNAAAAGPKRGEWAHVALVRNGSSAVTLFVGGVPVCSATHATVAASSVAAFLVPCLASDMRIYTKAKYASDFSSSFVPVVVPASDVARSSATITIGVTPSTYRTTRLYACFAGLGTGGTPTEVAFSARASAYSAPFSFTSAFSAPVYALAGASVEVVTNGLTAAAPGSVTLYVSKSSNDPAPATVLAQRAALSALGKATVPIVLFPTSGQWYVYARFSNADGLFSAALVKATAAVTVADYAFPTVASSTVPAMVEGVAASCAVVLAGTNASSFAASNIRIALASTPPVAATGLTYDQGTATVSFTVVPTRGLLPLEVTLTCPLANSSTLPAVTRVAGTFLVDGAAGFPYPTAFAVSPMLAEGVATSATVTVAPVPGKSGATCEFYVGTTEALATSATAVTASLSSTGTASATLTAQRTTEKVYAFVRFVTPSGVRGPIVRSSALTVLAIPTAIASVSVDSVTQSAQMTIVVSLTGASALIGSTATVGYASDATSASPTVVGTYALSRSGTVTFPVTVATTGSVFFYAKARSLTGQEQAAYLVSKAVGVIPATQPTDYTVFRSFVMSNTAAWAAFSSSFLAAYYKNMPAKATFRRSSGFQLDRGIQAWADAMKEDVTAYDASSTPYVTNSTTGPWWFDGVTDFRYFRRVWWEFDSPRVVTSIIVYGNQIGQMTPYVQDEIVGSNDGVNFVRIQTQWSQTGAAPGSDTVEDTFHVKYDRRKKGGEYAVWLPGRAGPEFRSVMSTKTTSAVVDPGLVCGSSVGFGGTVVEIVLVNATAYKYYGIGTVRPGVPYSSYSYPRTDTTTREYASYNFGSSIFSSAFKANGREWGGLNYSQGYHQIVPATDFIGDVFPWTVHSGFGTGAMFAIPQVSASPGVPAPVTYKHWRIRPSSSMWAWHYNSYPIVIWKFGLFRNTATATEDTYGLSPNNYLRQSANKLYKSGALQVDSYRDELLLGKLDWLQDGSVDIGSAVSLSLSEGASLRFTLDVEGSIGCIRFAKNMYFNPETSGAGGLILEAATSAEPTTWVPMVANTSGGATLGRDGLLGANTLQSSHRASTAVELTNTLFSVAPFSDTYAPPTSIGSVSVPGRRLSYNAGLVGCSVIVSGGAWTPGNNVKADFTVFLDPIAPRDAGPIVTGRANCIVTAYNATTGLLTFDVARLLYYHSGSSTGFTNLPAGTCAFVVLVRSGEGTGVTMAQLRSDPSYVVVQAEGTRALPEVAALTIPALVYGTKVACSMVLTGTDVALLAAANIKITVGPDAATGLTYVPGTGTIKFDVTPLTLGLAPVCVVLTHPTTAATETRLLGEFPVFVEPGAAVLASYAMPTAVGSVSVDSVAQNLPTTIVLTMTGASALVGTTAAVAYASGASQTPVGKYALSKSGTIEFPVTVATAGPSVFFYVKVRSPLTGQDQEYVSKAVGVVPETPATDYTVLRSFVNSNTQAWSAFSPAFLAAYYKNMPAKATFRSFHNDAYKALYPGSMSTATPVWSRTLNSGAQKADVSSTPYETNSKGKKWWGYGGSEPSPPKSLRRISWEFESPRVMTSVIVYSNTVGKLSEYIKEEFVASNDGINFVRIPTRWSRSGSEPSSLDTVEDTFHVKFDRRKRGGDYAVWLPASNRSFVSTKGLEFMPAGEAGKVCGNSVGFGGTVVEIVLVNAAAYRYYGMGSVGSDTPYSTYSMAETTTRAFARGPFGSGNYADPINSLNLQYTGSYVYRSDLYGTVISSSDWIGDTYPWTPGLVGSGAMFAIPQLSSGIGIAPPKTYKHWRIRPSSSFWGAPGNSVITLWKFGLFRDSDSAMRDTYGLSPDNYVAQDNNELYTSYGTSESKSADNGFAGVIDWSASPGGMSFYFDKDATSLRLALDVEGVIGTLRFQDNTYVNAPLSGGGIIIEAATAAEPTKWITMVATTASGAKLGRDGFLGSSAYHTVSKFVPMTNKLFSVAPFADTYAAPTRVGKAVVPGLRLHFVKGEPTTVQGCTILVSGGAWTPGSNVMADFSVHLAEQTAGAVLSGKFNCVVTNYNATTGLLTFDATPTASGASVFIVLVRSGEGTGITVAQLRSESSYVWVSSSRTWVQNTVVTDFPPPPYLSSFTVPPLVAGVKAPCSITLEGIPTPTLTSANIVIKFAGSAVAAGVVYAAAAGTAWFELTPPTVGTWPLEAVLTNPATGVTATRTIGTFVVGGGAAVACTFAATIYTLTGASVSVAASGYNANAPTCLALYASRSAADPFPTSLVSQRVELSATGTASVLATFPSPGDWYLYARLADTDGVVAATVQASGGSVSVADYALPTVAAQSFALFDGVTSAFTLALEGSNAGLLSAKNIQITLASSPSAVAATDVTYDAGSVSFKITSTLGTWPMSVVIAAPLADSSYSVTRSLGTVVVGEASTFMFPTAATLVAPQTFVRSHSATVTIALSAPVRTAGTAQLWHAPTASDAAPSSIGTYNVSLTGTVSFPFVSAAVGPVYFYVKAESIAGTRQASYLVAGPATTREFVLPESFVVTSELPLFVEGADAETVLPCTRMITVDAVGVTATPNDAVARATIAFSYNATKSWTGATGSSAGTLEPDGKTAVRIRLTKGGTYYLLARVTAPSGQYVDLVCDTPVSTILSPLWPSSSISTVGTTAGYAGVGAFHMLGADYRSATVNVEVWWPAWFFSVYNKTDYLTDTGEVLPAQRDNFAVSGGGYSLMTLLANVRDTGPTRISAVSAASPTFSFSWMYKRPMAVRRILLNYNKTGVNQIVDAAARFTLTGYTVSGSVESSTQVVHTITGTDVNERGLTWMEIKNPVACEFYRFMQTAGTLVGSNPGLTMVLGN